MDELSSPLKNPVLLRFFPFLIWWPLVTRQTLRGDITAGLIGAVLVLPQGMAFAVIAGMPPEYGLYAGMVPAIVAALFGSSWHLVSGPTTAASILLFSVLSSHAPPGSAEYVQLAITLTFMVGVIELGLGLLRVGVVVDFIPHGVVVGFTAGAALLIITNQLSAFFGVAMTRGEGFLATWGALLGHPEHINSLVLLVGVVTLVLGLASRHFFPKVPYMLVAITGGSLAAATLIHLVGSESHGIQHFSAIHTGLPPLSSPQWSIDVIRHTLPAALAVTMLALTEAMSIARSVALRTGQRIDSNQEFIGQGLSNLVGSFASAYVATGSFNRTGINEAAGARTPMAALIGGVTLMALVPVVAPVAAFIPTAAMAGILFLVAWGLIDFRHIHRIFRSNRSEFLVLIVTFLSTLLLDMEIAILAGVLLSLVFYLRDASRPSLVPVVPNPDIPHRPFVRAGNRPECPQLKFLRLEGSLFYGAINHVENALKEIERFEEQKHLVIHAPCVHMIDTSGAEMLVNESKKRQARGGGIYFIRVKNKPFSLLERGGYAAEIGEENFFSGERQAIMSIFSKLDPNICLTCQSHVFLECKGQGPNPPPLPPTGIPVTLA